MKLKLTKHFQDMMLYRGLSIDHVRKAIEFPDEKKTVFSGRMRVKKKIGTKTIEVIYCKDGFKDTSQEYVVITAYYL